MNTQIKKTKMCESVLKGIPCRYGSKCNFAHSNSEIQKKPCLFWNEHGFCKFGDACVYEHKKDFKNSCSTVMESGIQKSGSPAGRNVPTAIEALLQSPPVKSQQASLAIEALLTRPSPAIEALLNIQSKTEKTWASIASSTKHEIATCREIKSCIKSTPSADKIISRHEMTNGKMHGTRLHFAEGVKEYSTHHVLTKPQKKKEVEPTPPISWDDLQDYEITDDMWKAVSDTFFCPT